MTCPEAERRAAMSDGEFWAHVLGQEPDPRHDEDAYVPGSGDPELLLYPCPVCGTAYDACAFDDEGRPLIHAWSEEEDA